MCAPSFILPRCPPSLIMTVCDNWSSMRSSGLQQEEPVKGSLMGLSLSPRPLHDARRRPMSVSWSPLSKKAREEVLGAHGTRQRSPGASRRRALATPWPAASQPSRSPCSSWRPPSRPPWTPRIPPQCARLRPGSLALRAPRSSTGPSLPAPGAGQAASGRVPGCRYTPGLSAHAEWTVSLPLLPLLRSPKVVSIRVTLASRLFFPPVGRPGGIYTYEVDGRTGRQ